ncbi:MAG: hypothetical protein QOG09_251 [Solirubrobacterales bacterium]|jgi:uncharacterized protein YxjI|nr:hypothetical protein [Solirubrobacterales bacterium]MDX6662149.1 hypothetical protein [Solirubrobacterales bacterium]
MPVDPTEHDHFILRQRIRLTVNQYEFSLPAGPAGGEEQRFCFVQQKRFKFKEDIRFYVDDTKEQELMRIKARQRFDPRARYDVTDQADQKIGEIQKVFGQSLLRSTYAIFDANGEEVARAREANMLTAVLRRIAGFVPYVGDFADFLPFPYDFEFLRGEQRIGINRRRRWKLRDIYDIDMSADAERALDRRLVLAITVGMDALQAR